MQILIRSLMLSLSQESDLERQLRETLHRLEEELPLVYEVEVSELGPACRELEDRMASIAQSLAGYIDQLTPFEPDVDLFSERLGLSGRLDRLAPGLTPSLIRSGRAPESGIWKKDRITLAGYALLLGEKHKIRIDHGLVEYPNSGLIRKVQIHSVDRARVLRIRDRIIRCYRYSLYIKKPFFRLCRDPDMLVGLPPSIFLANRYCRIGRRRPTPQTAH